MTAEVWDGCYDDNWRDLIVDEAFAHPAKMARGLVRRIFEELFAMGALTKGSTVVDPFGGIGTTGIEAAARGVQFIGCELEEKFVALARQNFELHRRDWDLMGRPQPIIVQGDSRYLRQSLGIIPKTSIAENSMGSKAPMSDNADAVVSSPPYAVIDSGSGGLNTKPPSSFIVDQQSGRNPNSPSQNTDNRYGDSDGQMAKLPKGDVDAIVSSPPYEGSVNSERSGIDFAKVNPDRSGGPPASAHSQGVTPTTYGETDGQLGALPKGDVDVIVSSPPYAEQQSGGGIAVNGAPQQRLYECTAPLGYQQQGDDPANLANLPKGDVDHVTTDTQSVQANKDTHFTQTQCESDTQEADALVSSPPFPQPYTGGGGINVKGYGADGADKVGERTYQSLGGDRADGNLETLPIGQTEEVTQDTQSSYTSQDSQSQPEETFWSAAKKVVAESYAVLKPGGIAVWVVKPFVRDKKIVDFPGDWRRLCEHIGFETLKEVHASLVFEETHGHLFDGPTVKRTERKSFFRRLAEAKGSPRIDFEVVWVMRKPV